ncbi:MAG: polysulfide reductase NrfD [Gammaproteobacteria bacterium]|nr:polysulfide reductase NrfD [Gammaproteobacteria bacterium]
MRMLGLEHIYWGLPLVIYPFLSGLVAGSFIVGSLSKVFGLKKFEPLTRLSAIMTLVFLIGAPLGPLSEAVQRSRFWELYTRDHIPYSPLGLFIVIWTAYMVLVVAEIYYIFRLDNIFLAEYAHGWRKAWHKFLTLGSRDTSEASQHRDHGILVILSIIGILLAFAFHGYVGFVFGAIKARPLWSNPLMMPMFIVSAIVSGIALMILAYVIIEGGVGTGKVDSGIVDGLMRVLMWMIFVDLFLDIVDVVNSGVSAYTSAPVFRGFSQIFFPGGPLAFMYLGLQLGLLVVAMVMTFFGAVRRSSWGASVTALLVLVSVFAMRFDTVIGGELQPKVSQGLVRYALPVFGMDSIQVAIGIVGIMALLIVLALLLLPWDKGWVLVWSGQGGGDSPQSAAIESGSMKEEA